MVAFIARALGLFRGVFSGGRISFRGGQGLSLDVGRLEGGAKLRRFIFAAQNLTDEKLAELMADILRRVLLPELRAAVPRKSGQLRKSLVVVNEGAAVELRGVFYGRFVETTFRESVADTAMRILENRKVEIRELMKLAIRRELGVG